LLTTARFGRAPASSAAAALAERVFQEVRMIEAWACLLLSCVAAGVLADERVMVRQNPRTVKSDGSDRAVLITDI
jgi:hypothetical protein